MLSHRQSGSVLVCLDIQHRSSRPCHLDSLGSVVLDRDAFRVQVGETVHTTMTCMPEDASTSLERASLRLTSTIASQTCELKRAQITSFEDVGSQNWKPTVQS